MGAGTWAPLFDAFLRDPDAAGIFTDFDGTLSSIVDDPGDARPLDGVPEILAALAKRFRRVGVLSGRPVDFLAQHLPKSLHLTGLYGLEVRNRGRRQDLAGGGAWREAIDDVAASCEAHGPEGMRVEPKGLSLTLHYRTRPEIAEDVRAFAEWQAERSGLVCRTAKMSYELHPPVDATKASALVHAARGLGAVCFIGDDVGDLPAFDALDDLAAAGVETVRVAVSSSEAPARLIERADVVVDGPEGVAALLRDLVALAAAA